MQTAKNILLIEDDVDDQYLFCDAISSIHPNISYRIAKNGVEALDLVEQPPMPDLIFLDLNMPKMNGFECLKQLKKSELYKHIPVVILSTSNRREDIERCRELGAKSYSAKPTSFAELFNKLQNILKNGILR